MRPPATNSPRSLPCSRNYAPLFCLHRAAPLSFLRAMVLQIPTRLASLKSLLHRITKQFDQPRTPLNFVKSTPFPPPTWIGTQTRSPFQVLPDRPCLSSPPPLFKANPPLFRHFNPSPTHKHVPFTNREKANRPPRRDLSPT